MLSLLLTLLLLWLFFKLGIGLIKVIGFLLVAGIMFFFLPICCFLSSHCASRKPALSHIKINKERIANVRSFLHTFQIFSN